jgi:hypothetical protein
MNKNYLLFFMIVCYLTPIFYVYYYFNSNSSVSVSNIICDDNCKNTIFFFMFLMGIGTLLYEIERNDFYSIMLICLLLFGIYGLISINETFMMHYFFAFLVFIAIFIFMVRHCCLIKNNMLLLASLVLQFITLSFVAVNLYNGGNIFYGEIIYILNFAFYYLYLHFIQ